ncbi:hypothetical protein JCM10914A_32320 [Paenibacillus sp. JCM 10914]|uniref:hypothetical protein n=1 Tax=Paenibacillus sp. JCM 10914 TaxID=1236974 RepID=UPI0003CC279F|nr:hypothetical protein [Paenibacillus sp. JCM 10914]GAE07783.1 hypothetical protein JCM10914_4028 [Paenibacillus sp. JCM 10914]
MRDENNRNTLADLTYLEFEAKRRVSDTELIPEDDMKDVNTYTTQSLSSEQADHIAYDQNDSAPADADPSLLHQDQSANEAWEQIASEDAAIVAGEDTDEMNRAHPSSPDIALQGEDAADEIAEHEWRSVEGDIPSRPGDDLVTESSLDPVQRVEMDAAMTGSGTAFMKQDIFKNFPSAEEDSAPLEDVPDADAIAPNSPVDPAAPPVDQMHGIDLLNGSNGEEDTR